MAIKDIDQSLEEDKNVPLLEEQPAIPDAHADIFQMGNGPRIVRQEDLEVEGGIIILRPRLPASSIIGENEREPLRGGHPTRRRFQRERILRFRQQHVRSMEFHNVPRLHREEGDGHAHTLEVNIPAMIMGQGDGILAHPNQINPSQKTRNSTVSSIHGTAVHQMDNTGGEGEDHNSRGNNNRKEGSK
ncbi:hypothetical protein HNY73_005254 [Argiope bruennichi]|uniref:Uncharacterized protein n=1 Tax=Argiope bruennichi TaxID=94029 RepID=A0A8T0FN41_ARGBR|nr:hypothetical protein HNY73_005254 [Argiope bruennichi]